MEYTVSGFPILDDAFRVDPTLDVGFGYEGRDLASYPLNGLKCCKASNLVAFDRAELIERIKEKNANKSWVTDKCDAAGLHVKNQKNSNYCWGHSPVRGMEVCYLLMGGVIYVLSAFWACAQIKRGRNQGGSGVVAVEWLQDHGTCLESMHPPMNFKVNNDPAVVANAKLHQIVGAEEFDPRNNMLIYTSVVLDQPVTVGIPSMGHEMLITRLDLDSRDNIVPICDNSWGTSSGQNGRMALTGSKTRFDEAMSIVTVEPAAE